MSHTKRLLLVLAVLALCLATSGSRAEEYKAGSIRITDVWAPPSIGAQRTGAAYFTLSNEGPAEDKLLGLSANGAGWVALHANIIEGDVVRMRQLDGVSIAPGASVTLKPGGMHAMLFDLSTPLITGKPLTLTLQFARAGNIIIEAEVRDAHSGAPHDH